MHLMYVDESGDDGPGGTPALILAGVIVAETRLAAVEKKLGEIIQDLRTTYKLKPSVELRGSALIHGKADPGLPMERRVALLREALRRIAAVRDLKVLITRVVKADQPVDVDLFRTGWENHLRNYERFLRQQRGVRGARGDRGLVFFDLNKEKQLVKLYEAMRSKPGKEWVQERFFLFWKALRERPVDPLAYVIERPVPRRAADTPLIQAADLFAYAVYQSAHPNTLVKTHAKDGFMGDIRKALLTEGRSRDSEIRDVRPPQSPAKQERERRRSERDHLGRRAPVMGR